MTFRSYWKNL